jgi:type I restriction enzyme S subunit
MNKLPSGWEVKELGELGKIVTGNTPSTHHKEYYENGNYNFFSPSDLINKKYLINSEKKLSYKGFLISKKIPSNSILITGIGDIGRVGIVLKESTTNQQIHSLIVNKNYYIEFLYYLLFFNKKILEKYSTKQTIEQLNKNNLKKIKIFIPKSLQEQQKIAKILSKVDKSIEITQKIIEKEKKIKKGLLQKMLNVTKKGEPEIRFPEFSGKWVEKRIKDIFDKITRGNVLSTKEISKMKNKIYKYPVYSSQTLDSGLLGYYKEYLFENAITWTTDGANAGDVKFRKGKFYCTNVSGVLISNKGFTNQCIAEILNMNTKKYVSYTGNPKLMNNVIADIKIYIPPTLQEQQKVAEVLSAQDEKIEKLNKKFNKLKRIKKALMQDLLTGKVRVTKLLKDKK